MSGGSCDADAVSCNCLERAFFKKTHLGILTIFVVNNVEWSLDAIDVWVSTVKTRHFPMISSTV
jgi:hypothetical protein